MKKPEETNHRLPTTLVVRFRDLSHAILDCALQNLPRADFLRQISKILTTFSKCNQIEILLRVQGQKTPLCEKITRKGNSFSYDIIEYNDIKRPETPGLHRTYIENIENNIFWGTQSSRKKYFTKKGSFSTGDIQSLPLTNPHVKTSSNEVIKSAMKYGSLAIIPFIVGKERMGFLKLLSEHRNHFSKPELGFYEAFAQTLGLALLSQRSQAALHERVKELTCLYGIARAAEQPGSSLDEILHNTVELLPPAWQYPEITEAKITLDNKVFKSQGFHEGSHKQTADIVINGIKRGSVEVLYTQPKVSLDEGPFLAEERSLINTIAKELALITERIQTNDERQRLQAQLLHADRLATIGQLAAGVAHELNEPLANILGFSQLIEKAEVIPPQIKTDIEKITRASLHAREIVKKLLIFARQIPTRKSRVDINQTVQEGLYFLESRCEKEGITVERRLSPDIPRINVDQSQLIQVLVNLVVNAIQAMKGGGTLSISTGSKDQYVKIVIQDTGVGMDEETVKQIFLPFFTTKDIGQGTGLGLAVAHGIISAHGGTIQVSSELNQGSTFTILLPIKQEAQSETQAA